jgi:ankyrin repeat protein
MTEREILVEALAYAVTNHQLDAARLLLDRGADVNARPEAIPR